MESEYYMCTICLMFYTTLTSGKTLNQTNATAIYNYGYIPFTTGQ